MENSFQETDLFMSVTLQANAAPGQILFGFTDLIYRRVDGFLGRPLRGASALHRKTQTQTQTSTTYAPRGIRKEEFYCSGGRENGHCERHWKF